MDWRFLGILIAPGSLCMWEVPALLVYPLLCTGLGLRRCGYRWTHPVGGGRWGHYLRDLLGVHWSAQKYAFLFLVEWMWFHA